MRRSTALPTALFVAVLSGLLLGCQPKASAPSATAEAVPDAWLLDNERSNLAFVSIKAGDIPEAHRFGELTGTVNADGQATVEIGLASVDTGIEIRDERMREHVFSLLDFPLATVSAELDTAAILALPTGEQAQQALPLTLAFSGQTVPVMADVAIYRMASDEVVVSARQPVLLNADLIGIGAALDTLQEIAGLPSISRAVPVDFQLTFVGAAPSSS